MIDQVSPAEFTSWLSGATHAKPDTPPIVLDVREPWEVQTASVAPDGFTLMCVPMQSIPAQLGKLQKDHSPDQPIACLCHHGMRSQQVAVYLTQHGFTYVVNIQGGIDAWAQLRDPAVAQY